MAKDWTGSSASTFKTIGASNHCDHEREQNDYYATEPAAAEWLCQLEELSADIWEPACGEGHLSKVLSKHGHRVRNSDVVNRGYGDVADFLAVRDEESWDGDIVTNPPYKFAKEFVEQALKVITTGHKVCMFLKLTFLEGKNRKELFNITPPYCVWVSSSRLKCAMNGDFDSVGGSATAYAWFVWVKGWKGETKVKWFN